MLTLVIFLMGNNSNLADMGGKGGQKSDNLADIICERPLTAGQLDDGRLHRTEAPGRGGRPLRTVAQEGLAFRRLARKRAFERGSNCLAGSKHAHELLRRERTLHEGSYHFTSPLLILSMKRVFLISGRAKMLPRI